jgi:hypothetical protein
MTAGLLILTGVVAGAVVGLLMGSRSLRRTRIDPLTGLGSMSQDWWRDHNQRHRVEFHGVTWTWPVRKDRDG